MKLCDGDIGNKFLCLLCCFCLYFPSHDLYYSIYLKQCIIRLIWTRSYTNAKYVLFFYLNLIIQCWKYYLLDNKGLEITDVLILWILQFCHLFCVAPWFGVYKCHCICPNSDWSSHGYFSSAFWLLFLCILGSGRSHFSLCHLQNVGFLGSGWALCLSLGIRIKSWMWLEFTLI